MPLKSKQLRREPALPVRIAELIRKEIVDGQMAPGTLLPTEQTMAETYKVSRNVIREGIARLRNEGIVNSRQGVGAFVATTPTPFLRLDDGLEQPERHHNLFELRITLEVQSAELAAMRRTPEDLTEMQHAYDEMVKTSDWVNVGVEQDLVFHRAIAGATGNQFMLETIMFIAEHLKQSIRLTRASLQESAQEINEKTLREHLRILEAIKAGDRIAARAAMTTHVVNAAARVGLFGLLDTKYTEELA